MAEYNVDFNSRLMSMGDYHATHTAKSLAQIIDLTGKNAIVTGGTTGLGYAVANRLSEAGANVVIVGRSEAKGAIAEEQFRARERSVAYCQADLTQPDECDKVVKFCEEKFGPVDILVNNAARWIFQSFLDAEEKNYDKVMDINVKGVYFMGKAAARSMVANRRIGKIVNIASSAYIGCDTDNVCLMTTYEASKGAVVSLTKGMAKELKQYGINVNCVCPGSMDTYGNEYIPEGMGDYFEIDGFAEQLASSGNANYTTPDDPALTVFAFCTDLTNWVYGEAILTAGGRHLSHQKIHCALTLDLPEDYVSPRPLRLKSQGSAAKNQW